MKAYQLYSREGNFFGFYIWRLKETAEYMKNQMNEDREKYGLEPDIDVRTVEIVEAPF